MRRRGVVISIRRSPAVLDAAADLRDLLLRAAAGVLRAWFPGAAATVCEELSGDPGRPSVPTRGALACPGCDRVYQGPGSCPSCGNREGVDLERYYPSLDWYDASRSEWWLPGPELSSAPAAGARTGRSPEGAG